MQCSIPLDMVFFVDTVAEDAYQIINDDGVYAGDIYVALTFTREEVNSNNFRELK